MEKPHARYHRLLRALPPFLFFLLASNWTMYLYFFLHEAGHAIVVRALGGSITQFEVGLFNSGYAFSGKFSDFENSIRACAGLVFPILLWFVFVLVVPRKTRPIFGIVRFIFSIGFLACLLPVLVKVINYQNGWRSYAGWGDDVTQFLDYSHWNGYLTAGIVLIILALAAICLIRKATIQEAIAQIRREGISFMREKYLLLVMVGLWIIAFGLTTAFNSIG